MHSSSLAALATAAQDFLKHPDFASCRPAGRCEVVLQPLTLPDSSGGITESLRGSGCSEASVVALCGLYEAACGRLAEEARDAYRSTVAQLRSTFGQAEAGELLETAQAVAEACCRRFVNETAKCRSLLLDEVRLARARHSQPSTTAASAPSEQQPSGVFTEEVLSILNAAFSVSEAVSRGERRELSRVTGLSERQVLTWFANQRQRRSKKAAAAKAAALFPSSGVRMSPYDSPRRPSSHHHHQRQHLPPVRTVSGSSSLSSSTSSSLLSYATVPASAAEQDIAVGEPYAPMDADAEPELALLPPSAGASFTSFAAQYTVHAPAHPPSGDVEVPMMKLTAPTPVVPAFAYPPSAPPAAPPAFPLQECATYAPHNPFAAPSSPTFSTSTSVFLEQTFSAPAHHADGGSPASSHSSSLLYDVVADDAASGYFPSDASSSSCGYVPCAPAPTPSSSFGGGGVLDLSGIGSNGASGGIDAWMDSQFYEDLFGSLGLTSSSGNGEESVFDAQGGLTLSMEAVAADGPPAGQGGVSEFGAFF
ncbi:hypothetical protein JCM10213_005091 [Rhodosporidiobolus nylandii]